MEKVHVTALDVPPFPAVDFNDPATMKPWYYWCQHCGVASLKHNWGPGRVWCPACGKRPLSSAELRPTMGYDARVMLADLKQCTSTASPLVRKIIEMWEQRYPAHVCYRCEWVAQDCTCVQGPLIVEPQLPVAP